MYDLSGKSRIAQDLTVEIQNAPVSRELKYQVSFMQSFSFWKIHGPEIERSQGHPWRDEKHAPGTKQSNAAPEQSKGFGMRFRH